MLAFAANSVLCRLALSDSSNDPVSFTILRLLSGAVVLSLFFIKSKKPHKLNLDSKAILAPILLLSYALFFSLSYVQISAGLGALILFSAVQITMILFSLFKGQKLTKREGLGFLIAGAGFIYLVSPGLHRPPPISSAFMGLAGVSWGIYSLLGQNTSDPTFSTSRNFILTVPILLLILFFHPLTLNTNAYKLAMLSGVFSSGLGYVLWYWVLKYLRTSTAAIIQLSVPVIAAVNGILFLGEPMSLRLVISSFFIFGGILLKIFAQVKSD